jgi:hypothetical protein
MFWAKIYITITSKQTGVLDDLTNGSRSSESDAAQNMKK